MAKNITNPSWNTNSESLQQKIWYKIDEILKVVREEKTATSLEEVISVIGDPLGEDDKALVTRSTSFEHEVATGKRIGVTIWNKWGYNPDIDTAAEEVIASFGGTYTPPTSPTTLTLSSSSGNDTSLGGGGTGARTILITGIDANRNIQTQTISLQGVTPVVTTTTWLGINRIEVISSGSGQVNAGGIGVFAVSGGAALGYVPEGEGLSQEAIFHVPANHTFIATWLIINAARTNGQGSSPIITVRGYVFNPSTNTKYLVVRKRLDTSVAIEVELTPSEPFVITEGGVLYFTATTDKDNTVVDVRFSGKLQVN